MLSVDIYMRKILFLFLSILLVSCQNPDLARIVNSMLTQDRTLPQLRSTFTKDMKTVVLTFSEEITVEDATIDGQKADWSQSQPASVTIHCNQKLPLTSAAKLFIRVRDRSYNSSAFIINLFGRNTRLPDVVINEFSSKGTATQPDRIELEIRSDGNIEGLTLADGTEGNETHLFIMPDIDVMRGDYIVVYWDLEGQTETETLPSGSRIIHVYAGSDEGLSTNNGCFVMKANANSTDEILDCLVYSSGESTSHGGFGSSRIEASYKDLTGSYDWIGEPVNSHYTTSTRTINRRLGKDDTNTKDDFYICQTRGQTFGYMNSSKEYIPEG